MNYKKAVSPLIATTLLLVVVVGVGAVVTGMVRGYVTESKQKTDKTSGLVLCATELDFAFTRLGNNIQVCKNSTHVAFMLENKASEIEDFLVKIFTEDNVLINDSILDSSNNLGTGETEFFAVPYSGISQDDIIEIHVVPKHAGPDGVLNRCTDVALKTNPTNIC